VAITGIELINQKSGSREAFEHDDPVEIRVHYEAQRPIKDPNFVVRLRRADGTTAAMIRTSDYGFQLEDLEGEGYVSVVIDPLQLTSGAYIAAVTLLGPIDGVGLAWGESRWFQVSGLSLAYEESSGVFVPRLASAHVNGAVAASVPELASDAVS